MTRCLRELQPLYKIKAKARRLLAGHRCAGALAVLIFAGLVLLAAGCFAAGFFYFGASIKLRFQVMPKTRNCFIIFSAVAEIAAVYCMVLVKLIPLLWLHRVKGGKFDFPALLKFSIDRTPTLIWTAVICCCDTMLKMLLLAIPGLMAFYDYRMVYFCLADDPALDTASAMRRSRVLMYGHRMEYFRLDLSLLPLHLLNLLTLGIAAFWTLPYIFTVRALFFRSIIPEAGSKAAAAVPPAGGKPAGALGKIALVLAMALLWIFANDYLR